MKALRHLAARANTKLSELLYERRFGVDTTGMVRPDFAADYDGSGADNNAYIAASWRQLQRWLPRRDVGPGDVFLDVGCGKGRVVFQAARLYPFRRVIGLELDPQLAAVARGNVERNAGRLRCKDVEVVETDASTWDVPDDVTVVFLYNPFSGEVFERFVGQLVASVQRRPRTVTIVYSYPREAAVLERTGQVRLLRQTEPPSSAVDRIRQQLSSDHDYGVKVYALEPAPAAATRS